MRKVKGFTLVELMVVILIVAILAAVAIPILRGRIDAAKWSEGKAMMGTIATAIRAYAAEKGPAGDVPTDIVGNGETELGFLAADLTGTYFIDTDFSMSVTNMDPLTFTVTCNAGGDTDAPAYPGSWELDQAGVWSPGS
jgi:prepilin-type N-terminal cleavage/methylation domain-containing protein